MSIIKTPPEHLIKEINAVQVVAFGSNPDKVSKIVDSLPKDFVFSNYSVQDTKTTIVQNLPLLPPEKTDIINHNIIMASCHVCAMDFRLFYYEALLRICTISNEYFVGE